ncbi:hypothetical protein [Serratia sp. AKBS12]|uniref:hypothetical protein n=1 Tax=Serratia sp. AKBS12 TaxID=2974597 RepID=UPI002165F397|nr:hypothetical protein [Serratia sp. AKBS12]MCS3408860.1 hypothetical protein [Serratia sp. AKBS12]
MPVIWRPVRPSAPFSSASTIPANKNDRQRNEPPAWHNRHEINVSATETALHRTRLRNLDHKNFSVLFFYKSPRQAAPLLGFCEQGETENVETDFSFFQF